MPNQVITPPDISPTPGGYLIVNASQLEVELLARWMLVSVQDYTVYLYHEDMQQADWLLQAADQADTILISSQTTDLSQLHRVLDQRDKIIWFGGSSLKYPSPLAYLVEHD
jgi:hypothetical protein